MRALVALALATQIPVRAWVDEDNRTIATAWELLDENDDKGGSHGRVMGG
jgi:hypothetical protein